MGNPSLARPDIGALARRIGLLRAGVDFLGPARAVEVLGIKPRSLRAKLGASRGVHDADLRRVATALERRAADARAHAATILAALGDPKDDA